MGTNRLGEAGSFGRRTDGLLQSTGVQVMATGDLCARFLRKGMGRENILPTPLPFSIRVFAAELAIDFSLVDQSWAH